MQYRIGVDSGGTHMTAEAWSETGDLLATAHGGLGNSLVDYDRTLDNLKGVITDIFNQLTPSDCQLILAGVSGSASAQNQPALTAALQRTFNRPVRVISDADLALLRGLQQSDGALVIAGTGSVVLVQAAQHTTKLGGWGYLLGDEGSAFDITRRCFKRMVQEHDGLADEQLTPIILRALNVATLPDAISRFYASDRSTIASWAAKLATLGADNTTFQVLITEAAGALAAQISQGIRHLTAPVKLSLTGSVLTNNQLFRQTLIERVQKQVAITPTLLTGNNASGVRFATMEEEKK
ncbi:N-acetylglucosamine kinase [Lacticaseibacillus saniviri]